MRDVQRPEDKIGVSSIAIYVARSVMIIVFLQALMDTKMSVLVTAI